MQHTSIALSFPLFHFNFQTYFKNSWRLTFHYLPNSKLLSLTTIIFELHAIAIILMKSYGLYVFLY